MKRCASLFLLLGLTLLAPASANAAFPGQNGKIAFAKSGDIYTVNPDGTGLTDLTNTAANEGGPAWSPDGKKIAYWKACSSTCNATIWVMNADGTGQTEVGPELLNFGTTTDPCSCFDPAWSPDGTKIAFWQNDHCDGGGIWSENVDGTDVQYLECGEFDGLPAWSPDGTKIAFTTNVGDPNQEDIVTINPDGTRRTNITNTSSDVEFAPNWSPNGAKIAFICCSLVDFQDLYSMNADGTGRTPVTSNMVLDAPAWSPDGTKIVFMTLTGGAPLYTINPDGSGQAPIPNTSGGRDPDWQPILLGYARPKGAATQRFFLTPAYKPCTTPNETHALPLADGSCDPPEQASSYLTVGTPDANGKTANSVGSVKLTAVGELPINPNNGNQADLQIDVSITDVRNATDLSDYTGGLRAETDLRITDKQNSPVPNHNGTVEDTSYGFTVPCASTMSLTIGATCSLNTTADTLSPGLVIEGKRAIWQLGQLRLYDGGADQDADTAGDNTLFETQGIFVP